MIEAATDNLIGKVGGVGGLAGMVVTFLLHRALSASKKEHELEMAAVKADYDAKINTVTTDLKRTSASLEAAWLKLDDLRDNAVRKVEMKEYREEIRKDIKELGESLKEGMREMVASLRRELKREDA